jgi:hypothetical protein
VSEYKIVGSSYKSEHVRNNIYPRVQIGSIGFIEKEPTNTHDPNAIKVIIHDEPSNSFWEIGYLPKGSDINMETERCMITVSTVKNGKYLRVVANIPNGENPCNYIKNRK